MRAGLQRSLSRWYAGAELDETSKAVLDRVIGEAEVFPNTAPKVIGKETCRQKGKTRRRFRLRVGKRRQGRPR
jgi:hypothetical protein